MSFKKRKDYLILKIGEKFEPILYVLDEFQDPRSFESKESALGYMEVFSEKELNKKGIFIEPYTVWSDF